MVRHVLEPAAIAPEAKDSGAVLLKDEFVIVRHGVETRHHVRDFFYLLRHDVLHYLQLKMGVEILTLITHFVLSHISSILRAKYHYSFRL